MVSNTIAGRGKRFSKRFPVRFGNAQTSQFGFTANLSSTGLSIIAKRGFTPPARLELTLTPAGPEIGLHGEVRWCKKHINSRSQTIEFQMGVLLLERNAEYIDFLKQSIQAADKLFYPHPPTNQCFSVTYETQEKLVREYDDNMKRNGLFIPTDSDAPLNSTVSFTINLLEVMTVLHGEGVVIQKINDNQAQDYGTLPGLCLEITNFDSEDQHLLTQYVKEKKALMTPPLNT